MSAGPGVVFVDDRAVLGGGQLGLLRYLWWPERSVPAALVCFRPGPLVEQARDAGVAVTVLADAGERIGHAALLRRLDRATSRIAEPLVANSHSAALHLALLRRRRGRLRANYLRQEAVPDGLGRARTMLFRGVVHRRFDLLLANSRWTRSTVPLPARRRGGIPVVYPVSGTPAVRTLNAAIADARAPLRILSLSRLAPWKGIDTLIDAALELDRRGRAEHLRITVAGGALFGEEQYADELRRRAAAASVSIEFVGHVDDVDALLADHHVLVCASSTPEPFGQVIVQGIANGLVTIVARGGGAAEIVEHDVGGLVVDPREGSALADALERLVDEPGLYERLRAGGATQAERFVDARTLPALDAAMRRVADARPTRRRWGF